MSSRVVVHVWTTLSSPQSLLGLLNLREAAAGKNVAIEHHAFIPKTPDETDPEAIKALEEHGVTVSGAPVDDTGHAQEMVYAAKEQSSTPEEAAELGLAMAERLHRAALEDGKDISATDVLITIAQESGLDPENVRAGLDEGRWTKLVENDCKDGERIRMEKAPFLIAAGMFLLEGPQDAQAMSSVLKRAGAELTDRVKAAAEEAQELFGYQG